MTPLRNAAALPFTLPIIHPPSPSARHPTLVALRRSLSHSTRWKFSGIIRDLRRGKRASPLREKDERLHLFLLPLSLSRSEGCYGIVSLVTR